MKAIKTSFIILCLLALASRAAAQKRLDITIIGTAHYFDDEYQQLQSFDQAKDFIVDTNPDIICIEAIPVDDTLSLSEIWPNTMKRADHLKDSLIKVGAFPYQNSDSSKSEVFWSTYEDRPELLKGAEFYASYDLWNAFYYWNNAQVENKALGYFSRFQKDLSHSEYGLIVYPAARELGVDQFHGIDYRDGEKIFLESTNKVLKKLLFNFKWKPLKSYLRTQKQYKKAQKEGNLIEFINGDQFQNSFSNLIDDIPQKLPKSEEAKLVRDYWLKRNRIMSQRIIETAEREQAQKIVVTVGSAHVTHLKRFLEEQGHSVSTYGEFLNTQNQ